MYILRCAEKISAEIWDQVKTASAAGIGLREIARNMNLPPGTVLARAQREGWTKQIQAVKQQVVPVQSTAITPMQSVAVTMQERAGRHVHRMAGVTEKVVGHIERLDADEILTRSARLEKIDTIARRMFGLNDVPSREGALSLNILANHSAVQVVATSPDAASPDE
jgi:hypothetical protein